MKAEELDTEVDIVLRYLIGVRNNETGEQSVFEFDTDEDLDEFINDCYKMFTPESFNFLTLIS